MNTLQYKIYRFLWDYAGKLPVRALPVHLDLEVTSRCNLACIMCPHGRSEKQFKIGDMPLELARGLIKSGAHRIKSVKFNWRGEPTLYRALPELIALAKECGYVETMINTNLNCNQQILRDLVDAGLDKLIVSIDSFVPEIYAQIRKGGNLRLVLDNLDYLKGFTKNKNTSLSITVQARRQKLNENESFPAWVSVKPASQRTEEGSYLMGKLVAVGRVNCLMPFRRLLVSWEGNVFGCCADWFEVNKLADISVMPKETLAKIWRGSQIGKLRRDLRMGKAFESEPCKSCFSRESYIWKKPA